MKSKSTSEIATVEAVPLPAINPNSNSAKAAIKRCVAAWQRAFDAEMNNIGKCLGAEIFAAHAAGPAYCGALPPLAGYESTCDFIACVAHGILLDAIPQQRANQLLYAAQVALSALQHQPKPRKASIFPQNAS